MICFVFFLSFGSIQFDPAMCFDNGDCIDVVLHALRFRRESDSRHHNATLHDSFPYGESIFFLTPGVSHLNVNFCRRYSDGSEQNTNDLRLYFKTLPFPIKEYSLYVYCT